MHRLSPVRLLPVIALASLLVAAHAHAQPTTAASKVKATATATKPDAEGRQTVTIILDIDKDCVIYANPAGVDFLEAAQTRVKISAKEPVRCDVKYPAGNSKVAGRERWYVYQGRAVIEALVTRSKGDAGPLAINIHVQGSLRDAV
jgi:DsbC/DsbD-like thiol-disulfide interchange protein